MPQTNRNTTLRLGVLSDTHGALFLTQAAVQLFQRMDVDTIIHCGDIGGTEIIRAFRGLDAHFVYGNTDGENPLLSIAADEAGCVLHGWFGSLERAGKNIFFLHGHQETRFQEEIRSEHWDLICFGHTHQATFQQYGSTRLLNPGALQRVATPRVAIVTLPEIEVQSYTLDRSSD